MRLSPLLLLVLLLCVPLTVNAESLKVDKNLTMEFQLPNASWTFSTEPPVMLLGPTMADVRHDLQSAGKSPAPEQVAAIARKRLAQNQGFVFDAASGAYLLIDFSPLKKDEKAPSDEDIQRSVRYAVKDLEAEQGVSDVKTSISPAEIKGARSVYQLDATYRDDGRQKKFSGLTGYVPGYWFFLYYTDPLKKPSDTPEMSHLLQSVVMQAAAGKDD